MYNPIERGVLMVAVGDVQNFGGVSMVYTGSGWTTNAQTQAIDAAARNTMATEIPGGYEAPGVAGPSGFSPLDPAPWPPKDTDRIAGMGFQCIPADWPDPQSGYYSFGLSNIPPRCEDLNAAQASQIPFGSAFIGLTNERVLIDNSGQVVGPSPYSQPGRVTFEPSPWTPDFRALNPNIGAANPIAAPPAPALGQSGKSPDLTTPGAVPTSSYKGLTSGTTAVVGTSAGGGIGSPPRNGVVPTVTGSTGGNGATPATRDQAGNANMLILIGIGVVIVFLVARG